MLDEWDVAAAIALRHHLHRHPEVSGHEAGTAATVAAEARSGRLGHAFSYEDIFSHCENHPEAVAVLRGALDAEGVVHRPGDPMYPSEDFGHFAKVCRSAMFFLGAGVHHPRLHNPDYDFADDLIPIGARVFLGAVADVLG